MPKPRLPNGIRIYAISDVHGCANLLQQMFTVIDKDLTTIGSMRPIHALGKSVGEAVRKQPPGSKRLHI